MFLYLKYFELSNSGTLSKNLTIFCYLFLDICSFQKIGLKLNAWLTGWRLLGSPTWRSLVLGFGCLKLNRQDLSSMPFTLNVLLITTFVSLLTFNFHQVLSSLAMVTLLALFIWLVTITLWVRRPTSIYSTVVYSQVARVCIHWYIIPSFYTITDVEFLLLLMFLEILSNNHPCLILYPL